ncbi:helix-turn-helix domain-containing protein [Streptomyces marincola]|uniref:helix-turn-helix domain-containing protein n=1 Tax=Streptomyces marincola TaxID=2878388 RepID=UPI001CF40458|nr:helix-turn-helix domain-containing protein [Streptomyces marincola]UCM88248.1 helix-turn-helix domain-containing protein [Streptomyces marincola]
MDVTLRRELGAHLRASRETLAPDEVGLRSGGRRRAPGLRREEVATLAGVSVAWYTWLEQGRVATSRQVIDAVCRAPRMDPAAHRHALALAGYLPDAPLAGRRRPEAGPEIRALLDAWRGIPAAALDERLDILAVNAAHRRLWGGPGPIPGGRDNLLLLLASGLPERAAPEVAESLLRGLYQQYRAAVGHAPEDARATEIVRQLHAELPDAAHWWNCRAVADFRPVTAEVRDGRGTRQLTFSLLRPVADPGLLLLRQTPADH